MNTFQACLWHAPWSKKMETLTEQCCGVDCKGCVTSGSCVVIGTKAPDLLGCSMFLLQGWIGCLQGWCLSKSKGSLSSACSLLYFCPMKTATVLLTGWHFIPCWQLYACSHKSNTAALVCWSVATWLCTHNLTYHVACHHPGKPPVIEYNLDAWLASLVEVWPL